jgi:TetR/AcrR family transcriptional regulator, regulator of biofilm formation and stress response
MNLATASDPGSSRRLSRRGRERKIEMLEAALRIVGRDGLAALSMRSLAVEAGMPLGATTYYFTSKSALIAEAFRLHASRETERVLQAIRQLPTEPSARQLADQMTNFLLGGLTEHRRQLISEYELLVGATREPELASLSRSWQQAMQRELRRVAKRLGSPQPAIDAQLLLGLLAGLEVDHLSAEPDTTDQAAIRAVIQRAVGALFPQPQGGKPPSPRVSSR